MLRRKTVVGDDDLDVGCASEGAREASIAPSATGRIPTPVQEQQCTIWQLVRRHDPFDRHSRE
ncbi:hypothetical protein AWB97_18100 [Mycobacterium intracellulare subsp. chimaera]|nr:hypothetical protein AWB97_18100 [Mycobacterium intracellulare subsp. chimaera]